MTYCADVAVISAAASTKDVEGGQQALETLVISAVLLRITVVQFLRVI